MRVKKPLIVGCLALGLACTGQLSLADSPEKQNQDEPSSARSEPKINDYSNLGEGGYSGPRPQGHINKKFRSAPEAQKVAAAGADPVVNDYSDMGVDYSEERSSPEPSQAERTTPVVNDYSSMGAEYGSESETTQTENTDSASASRLDPPRLTYADLATGYEKYNGNCAQCHGQDAVGSSFAPSLVTRLKKLEYADFVDVVINGKTVFDSATGGYSVMPAWKGNAGVTSHLDEIWGYLKARSEGKLGPGRPE